MTLDLPEDIAEVASSQQAGPLEQQRRLTLMISLLRSRK